MKKIILLFTFSFFISFIFAQSPTQNIKGKVFDRDSKNPLVGATVYLADSSLQIGAYTDENGEFRLENVPVGRQTVLAKYASYADYTSSSLILTSGKETELNIAMTEQIGPAVEIKANSDQQKTAKPVNDFSEVSTRSFSIEQVQRYPASLSDPSRMAMALPGVQASRDFQNDIIIRGNAPVGLLWRLEGVDILNPNHFARISGSGGSISMFSLSLMSESDFSTGAFAPEYGNAFGGVFDMKFRKGNMEKREYTIRAGVIGLDFATEGPIKKGKSSYLVNYRYSTLGLLEKAGIRLSFNNSASYFQDLSFNIAQKVGKNGNLSIFGVGGDSRVRVTSTTDTTKWKTVDDYFGSDYHTQTGIAGITYTHLLDDKSYIRAAFTASRQYIRSTENVLMIQQDKSVDSIPNSNEKYRIAQFSSHVFYNRKFSSRLTMKTGILGKEVTHNFYSYYYNYAQKKSDTLLQGKGNNFWVIQPYIQARFRVNEKLTLTGGVHAMALLMNKTYSVEPRLAAAYKLNANHSFSLAYGLHGQTVPIGTYYATVKDSLTGKLIQPNLNLNIIKAHHLVFAYNFTFLEAMRLRVEAYYQYLYKLPVSPNINSTYMALNERFSYGRGYLVSKGTGQNYGVDVSLEQFFSNRMFFLLMGSLFRSEYTPLNGKTYSTRNDSRYNTSLMVGKEWNIVKAGTIEAGFRASYTGGLHYTPVDTLASKTQGYYVGTDSLAFTGIYPYTFRVDSRVAYRWSAKKYSFILSLDIQNTFNRKNVIEYYYDATKTEFYPRFSSALVPVLNFTLDW
jgi:hypothetical protein